jgi:hypothetical protein
MRTLAATYPSLADALRTRQELQELHIPSEDISIAMRRGSSAAPDPDQPEVLTLGWLERAIAGWPSEPGETDIAQALRRAGIHELIATHLAYDVDHGGVLVATVIDAAAHRERAELIMAKRARFPDLVGETRDQRSRVTERTPIYAPGDASPSA